MFDLLSICAGTVITSIAQNSPRGCWKGHPWLLALEKSIVALPVLDAVAVTQDNADWAKEAMLRAWFEHAHAGDGVARSRVKVDYSDLAC